MSKSKQFRPTEEFCEAAIRQGMTDADALHYVPVDKMAIVVALKCIADRCGRCDTKNCRGCMVATACLALKDAIMRPAMFDEDFNLLPCPCEAEPQEG